MSYERTSHKLVIVVDRNLAADTLLNAAAHLSLGLGTSIGPAANPLAYPAPSLGAAAVISEFPVILLEAKSDTQLLNLLTRAAAAGEIRCNFFSGAMLGASAREQQSATAALTRESAQLFAVALFGPRDGVDELSKKFSVYNAAAASKRLAMAAAAHSATGTPSIEASEPHC